ncbi:MAG: hypothetical protein GY749_39410, partial [Desulfobacteraceae bacterium]|nr:hypothetical protein [Desulfobacteraceae bacterium]
MEALLDGHNTLEECFAEIKVELVRQELKKLNEQQDKIPTPMKKVLQKTLSEIRIFYYLSMLTAFGSEIMQPAGNFHYQIVKFLLCVSEFIFDD